MIPEVKLETLDALNDARIDGTRLVLPTWMDRTEYQAVDQVLRNLGGTWNRQAKAHVFESDPTEAIRQVLDTGQAPGTPKSEEGFVATPPELAQRVIREVTDLGDRDQQEQGAPYVLDPSAGEGALVEAIQQADPHADVLALEPNQQRADRIARRGAVVRTMRLEDYLHSPEVRTFDLVVANPPFAVPGRPTVWIDHTWHAWSLLKLGGRLVSIAPRGLEFHQDRKHREIRNLIERYGGDWFDLDQAEFAGAVLFWVDKPANWQPGQDIPKKRRGKPTASEQAEQRAEDRKLRDTVDEALKSGELAQQLADRLNATPNDCRLKHYSPRNAALVFVQADALGIPVTGHLNTVRGWAQQGRTVAKGSTGIRIVAATGDEDQDQNQGSDDEESEPQKRFRMTTRFDLSQTTDMSEK